MSTDETTNKSAKRTKADGLGLSQEELEKGVGGRGPRSLTIEGSYGNDRREARSDGGGLSSTGNVTLNQSTVSGNSTN